MFYMKKEEANLTENHQQAPTVNAPDSCAQKQKKGASPSAQKQKKGTSQKKIESNRRNSLHSPGPRNTQRTRHNAMRHGLLAEGLTEWDDPAEYQEVIHDFTAIYPASDPLDAFLIEHIARDMVRSRRAARLEAENITALSSWPDPSSDPTSDRCSPMIDPTIMTAYAGPVLDRLERYTSAALNRMLRCRRELERIRRDEPGPGEPTQTSRRPM